MCYQKNVEDLWVWNVMIFIGINMKTNAQRWAKCVSWVARVLFHLSVLHQLGIILVYLSRHQDKIGFSFLPRFCLPIIVWHIFSSKIKQGEKLFTKIYGYRKWVNFSHNKSTWIINGPLLFSSVYSLLIFVASVTMSKYSNDIRKTLWSYFLEVKFSAIEDLFVIFYHFSYCYVLTFVPIIMTLVACCIEYRIGEILTTIRKRLEKITLNCDVKEIFQVAELYLKLLDVTQQVKNILSPVLFALISFNYLGLFISLSRIILITSTSNTMLLHTASDAVLNITMIVAQVLCGSVIPDCLDKIKLSAKQFVRKNRNPNNKSMEVFFIFKTITDTEIIYLTGYDIFKIEKKLVLNLFASLLTYGLLIINLNVLA